MKDIECGQIYQVTSNKYNIGEHIRDYFVVLSRDKNLWLIGCFWNFKIDESWGGARQRELNDAELHEVGKLVGHIKNGITNAGN